MNGDRTKLQSCRSRRARPGMKRCSAIEGFVTSTHQLQHLAEFKIAKHTKRVQIPGI